MLKFAKLSIAVVLFALLAGSLVAKSFPRGASEGDPTLLKRTFTIETRRFLRYWPNPNAKEPQYNTWCWAPNVRFDILGPIAGGSQFIFEATTPDGKPWISYKLRTQEVGNDEQLTIKGPDLDENVMEKMATTQTGLFPFKVTLKNALSGTNTVYFSGKFKVATYSPDQAIPEYKSKKEFYVVHDWRLPVGYMWFDPRNNENVPPFSAQFWFRGTKGDTKMQGVLYYKGKQIATSTGGNNEEITTGVGDPQGRWALWTFLFGTVKGFNHDTSANTYPSAFFLDKNPGDYEVKILRDQKLARSATFAVGSDGKLVDNGFAKQFAMGGVRFVLPVKIIGDQDLNYDPQSWRTDMFYGNQLDGFSAP